MSEIPSGYKTGILIFLISIGFVSLLLLKSDEITSLINNRPVIKIGVQAPDFAFPDLDGKITNLSDYRGKLVLLNVWATWCKPCRDEMPSMEKLYNKFKEQDFEILAVSVDAQEEKVVRPFMKSYNLSFKALLDKKGTIQDLYQTKGVPESFIIDRNGVIIEKVIGSFDWSSPKAFQYFEEQLEKSTIQKE